MDEQNRNLLLATGLSLLVIIIWFVLFPPPEQDPNAQTAATTTATTQTDPSVAAGDTAIVPQTAGNTATPEAEEVQADPATEAPRVEIDTPTLKGSVSLRGGRIDDLKLKNYRETLEDGSPIVTLMSPIGSNQAYYALFGWAPGAGLTPDQVPGANTIW